MHELNHHSGFLLNSKALSKTHGVKKRLLHLLGILPKVNNKTVAKNITSKPIVLGQVRREEIDSFFSKWNRILMQSDCFKVSDKTPLSILVPGVNIINREHAMVRRVLSEKFDIPVGPELISISKSCNRIFHEDFPGHFILEYKGKRLGMFFLNFCKEREGVFNLSYRFKNDLKSFAYL